ncbi:MAG: hypothetical protein U1F67_19395 [Rubrivivax sp.]
MPMWPTFGISLQQAPASAQDIAPWLPKYHEDGQADRHDGGTDDHHPPGARVAAFLFALWRAAWQWNDMAMVRVAGVRDRVVRVYLKPGQGGVNIKMTREEIQALAEKQGKGAAKAFIERFAAEGSVGWREHRWVRLNRLLIALRAAMTRHRLHASDARCATWPCRRGRLQALPLRAEQTRNRRCRTCRSAKWKRFCGGCATSKPGSRTPATASPTKRSRARCCARGHRCERGGASALRGKAAAACCCVRCSSSRKRSASALTNCRDRCR